MNPGIPKSADPATVPGSAPRSQARVTVVLPAFNEQANLGRLLERIDESMSEAHLAYQVVVVDDGSTDNTLAVLKGYESQVPLTIVRHETNQGLGSAIRDGLLFASERAAANDVIITMDADETHTPGLILRMLGMIREGHDVVIASRYQPGSRSVGVPIWRRFLSACASLLFRMLFPTPGVHDFTCGYRAYRAGALKLAISSYGGRLVDHDGFQCMVDLLLKLRKLKLVIGEVPVVLRYDLKEGQTKMPVARTVRDTLALLVKRRLGF